MFCSSSSIFSFSLFFLNMLLAFRQTWCVCNPFLSLGFFSLLLDLLYHGQLHTDVRSIQLSSNNFLA